MVIPLIPAYCPDPNLVELVNALLAKNFKRIVVVNDGSDAHCDTIFAQLSEMPQVSVLHHAVNLGKGAALKTGFNFIASRFPEAAGCVTLDADGQHAVEDVCQVACSLIAQPQQLVVGVRRFKADVPWRSKIGNVITKYLFRLLAGTAMEDTQSGLRGIPRALMLRLLTVRSNGYEFELDMLMIGAQQGVPIEQVPIETIYIDDNQSSHFRPLIDSMRIYFVLLRFSFIAVLSACLDYGVFMAVVLIWHDILAAIIAARAVSMSLNYLFVKRLAFNSEQSHWRTLPKYLLLALFSGGAAYFMIVGMVHNWHWDILLAKIIAESIMFVVNFVIQRDFIFKRSISVE